MNSQTLRVLLAEDGITETGLTLRALCADQGRGLELVFVSDASKLSATLLHSHPHIAFLALSMLQPDPPRAVSLLHQSVPHIPLILFIQPADKDFAAGCLQAGAENYMLEGFLDVPTLDHVLHTAILRNASTLARITDRLHLDTTTNLPNRFGLLRQLQLSSQDSVLSGSRLLISVQLRNLEELQASTGHLLADQSVRQVSQQLRSLIRPSDLLAYVAPGIFIMILFDASDSCRTSLQRRIECCLLQLNQQGPVTPLLKCSVKTSFWSSTTAISFPHILTHHFSSQEQPPLSQRAPAGNHASRSAVRSG